MTFDNLFQQYFELKKSTLSKTTIKTIISNYDNHLFPTIGDKKLEQLSYIDYQKLANNLLDGGLAPKTVKNIFLIVSGVLHYALKMELYDGKDFVQYVEVPDFDNKQYFTISSEMQKKYIQAIMAFPEPIYKDIFLFLLHGRRLREVLELEWQFLDLNEGIMYIPSTRNKSKRNLSFKMTQRQLDALRPYQLKEHQLTNQAFLEGYVFKNPKTGKPFVDISKAWKRLLKRSNLPKIRIHDIRHLIGTYLINELNTPIEHVSHLLGHSSVQITQRYVNPKPSNARDAMNNLFDSVKTQGELHVQKLNEAIVLGEFVQKTLFPVSKYEKVKGVKND